MSLDMDDEFVEYVDEHDEETRDEYAGGSSPAALSMPDESPRAEIIQELAQAVKQALDTERKYSEDIKRSAARVTTNLSGEVFFQRFTVPANQAIQICREKELRGDIVITNPAGTGGDVSVGLHAGIMNGGTDTVTVVLGSSRVVRTKRALWAIASSGTPIDIQEEFD